MLTVNELRGNVVDGILKEKSYTNILPSYIDSTNFKYVKIDNKYLLSIAITSFPKEASFLEIMDKIPKDVSYDMSMFVKKQDTHKTLKELTYYISSSSTEIKTIKQNQVDIDVINKVKEDAKKLRHEIQINNEEVFYTWIYISFWSEQYSSLISTVKSFQSKIYSKQIISNITNFRHLDSYISSLPFNVNSNNSNYINMTTSSLGNIFPFYTNTVFDENGIIFGFTKKDNKLCNIDIFDRKYLNANMCIFGSSGGGKSYFTKSIIIKNFFKQTKQIVFDPEGEYVNLAKRLGGEYICPNREVIESQNNKNRENSKVQKYFNVLEITSDEIYKYKENFLEEKITKEVNLFCKLINDDSDKIKIKLEAALAAAYEKKGITKDINTMYLQSSQDTIYLDKILKRSKDFPTILDMLENISSKSLKKILKENILDKFSFLNSHTNINLNSNLMVFDFSELSIEHACVFAEYFLEKSINIIKMDSSEKIIYFDEIWKYISLKNQNNISRSIFLLFKTIRKHNASIVSITQDISDFFSLDSGNYGKSILNNAGFKVFFKTEFTDLEVLKNLRILTDNDLYEISKLDKGQSKLLFKNSSTVLNIQVSDYENSLIEGGELFYENSSSSR